MKTFQTVLFVFAILVASTQTMRHVYVKWIAPEGSVLDQFNTQVESNIATADSLEELVPLYADATDRVAEFEADPANQGIEPFRRTGTEPYLTQMQLRQAIQQRERTRLQLVQLFFYWSAGLIAIAVGMVAFGRVNQWLGMAGVLTGFSELLWWTSPLTSFGVQGGEFETLLNVKLVLSVITMVGVITVWLMLERGLVLTSRGSAEKEFVESG